MQETTPFRFFTERRLVQSTGYRATNLRQLSEGLRTVGGSSIFYHTHHLFLSHHFEKPVFYNDFANWAREALQKPALGERLASVDLRDFPTIRQLRAKLVELITAEMRASPRLRECPPGEEFHFCRSKSFVISTGLVAESVEDFFLKLPQVTNISLYYHLLEARLRLDRPTNDFSIWLESMGEPELGVAIDKLDPYRMTLDEIRELIISFGRNYVAH